MYNTSQNYKDKILNDSTQHELNIYINGNKIEENHIIDFKITLELFNNDEFCLGSTPELDVEFEIDKRDLPNNYNEVYIESGLEDEIVPIGKFTIQSIEDDEFKVKIKATDYMKKFEDNKYDGSDLTYPATMLQVLQDICTKIGVELGSTSFLNSDKQISVYDNTVSARTYIGYIAEQAEGFAVVGRDGKLYIRTFGQNTAEFDINLFSDFSWGDKFKVSKVSYEDGAQNYKFGNNTGDTVYINQNNMYIVDSDQVERIYKQIKDFEVYSFEGETIIDPAYDIGDILIIDGKKVLFQGELDYAGKFKASIKSKIQTKTEQESMQTKQTNSNKIKRVQSEINQIDGKITQLAQETTENTEKITEHEVSIDEISNKVSNIADLTNSVEGVKIIALANCVEGNLLELNIKGNNTVFDYLYPSDDLYPSNNLYPRGDSRIVVANYKSGSEESDSFVTYELGITDVLRQNENVYDEYILKDGKAQVIRKINADGSIKDNEEVEELGEYVIELREGTNTIEIQNYTARIKAKWAIKSNYTDVFATKVKMNSEIKQTADSINSEVRKKVDENEVISKINQSAEQIKIEANKININGTISANGNFIVDKNGTMSCKNANISGNILLGGTEEEPEFIVTDGTNSISVYPTGIFHEYGYSNTYVAIAKGGIGVGTTANDTISETGKFDTDGIQNKAVYDNSTSSVPNLVIDNAGYIYRSINTSSNRYKEQIKNIENEELKPERLYDLPIKQFKYKKEYQPDTKDCRYNKELIGFIAEDLAQIYPIAVDYNKNGEIENWNERYIIPAMLKLIQQQHLSIKELFEKVEELENKLKEKEER